MEVVISLQGGGGWPDNSVAPLGTWLGRERELRGRVRRAPAAAPPPAVMGTATDLLTVVLEPGGVATVLAAALVAWVQRRAGSQTVTVTRPDGTTLTVAAEHVRGLDARQVSELAQQLARSLEPGEPIPGEPTRPPAAPAG
ncbi:hypothetical protein [Frankia sp. CiP3]|uniref:effector-associated constant component EACC1 n=1 Tax=Frankia sp. CiP3 TaxID=2880971 RepID=UPI001EF53D01|nr:hypothetical protein [Frankia sp. CiP3]